MGSTSRRASASTDEQRVVDAEAVAQPFRVREEAASVGDVAGGREEHAAFHPALARLAATSPDQTVRVIALKSDGSGQAEALVAATALFEILRRSGGESSGDQGRDCPAPGAQGLRGGHVRAEWRQPSAVVVHRRHGAGAPSVGDLGEITVG